jgi:hypothetical protein
MALLALVVGSGGLYRILDGLILHRATKRLEQGTLRLAGAASIPVLECAATKRESLRSFIPFSRCFSCCPV